MNRRLFIKNMIKGIKTFLLLQFLFPSYFLRKSIAAEKIDMNKPDIKGMSLRQIADQKLHHGNGRFQSLFTDRTYGDLWKVIKWRLFSKNHFTSYYKDEPTSTIDIDWEPVRQHDGLSVTFIKHSTLMIKDKDQILLIDPVFSKLFGLVKDFTPLAFDVNDMPHPHRILITHGHYDHLDKKSLSQLKKSSHVITPLGYDSIFSDLEMNNRTQLDWFDSVKDNDREIILLPCNHWTMRNPRKGPNLSLWGSYLIKTASGFTIYVSGDLGYFNYFKELGELYRIDLAIFNLGAYEPRWFMNSSHMNPFETAKAFKELNAKYLMVVHWGTFRLGDEPVHFPPMQMKAEMKRRGMLKQLVDIKHGQTLFYDTFVANTKRG